MIEVQDMELINKFINDMNDRGYEIEYRINEPEIIYKEYFDSKEKKIKPVDIMEQQMIVKLTKTTLKKS